MPAADVVLVVAGVGVAFAMAQAPRLAAVAALLLVAGALVGQARLRAVDAPARFLHAGEPLAARAWLLEWPRPSQFGSSAEVRIVSGPAKGAHVLARAPGGWRWPGGGSPGTGVDVRGLLEVPKPSANADFDYPAYLRRRGIRYELALDKLQPSGAARGGLAGMVDWLRGRAERGVTAGLSPGNAALASGMVLGEDQRISSDVKDDFRRSGLSHLLAVSGQNVMLLGALVLPIFALIGLGPRARLAGVGTLVAIYVPLAGAGPSLQRAGVMGAAGLAAAAAARPVSRTYALLLAAAATLVVNPRVAGDPGWQLSFAAVVGIALLVPGLRRMLRWLPGPIAEGAAVTSAATLATAPLLAHHFHAIQLVALPSNLLALPVVAPIMWSGMVQAALGAAGGPALTLASLLGRIDGLLLGYLRAVARWFGDAPHGQASVALRSPVAVVAAYVLMAAAALLVRRLIRSLEPRAPAWAAEWRRVPRLRRFGLVATLVVGVGLAGWWATGPPGPPRQLTVSFLDVGQGDATLIQDPSGAAVLFDGGPPEARAARLIRNLGVKRLSLVVATHQSRDHQGGLHEVLRRFPVGLMLDGGDGTRDPDFRALEQEADARGIRRVTARAGETLRAGGLTVQILSPGPRPPGPPPSDPNARAVVAVIRDGGFSLFLSADAESPSLLPLALPRVTAMKVPHHGSADPGLPQVLARLRPQVAAIEVGAHNTYGHPRPSTLAALKQTVPHVYRTDRDGTIKLTVAGGRLTISTHA
ncbi:MAG TPA: ComEC/Rec2 family competence protein [Thermoleophilaceae bacterium]|nr:ComEC/Rec2 family competence protein [Thermoleophilaceae bacterium]